MSLVKYPDLLPLPLQADYSYSIAPNVKRSTMSDGWVRQRKVTSNTPNSVNVSFMFTESEYCEFMRFFTEDINEGADWFLMRLTSIVSDAENIKSLDNVERAVRIQSGKINTKLNFYDGRYSWKVTAVLDIDVNLALRSAAAVVDWDNRSQYDLEIIFNGGLPKISGLKKCYLASGLVPTGAEEIEPCIILDDDSDKIGIDFYTEALKLNTDSNTVLEVQSYYKGTQAYTGNGNYYFISRIRNTEPGDGLGLTSYRNNRADQGEYAGNTSFRGINKAGSTVTYNYQTPIITQRVLPIGTSITRRDIWINDTTNNTCTYYCILNGQTAAKIIYTSCITLSACLYHIGDRSNNGCYQYIKLTAIKAANHLFEGLPDD